VAAPLVATLGPATDGLEHELIAAGLDVARLNFSHGTLAEHARRSSAVRAAAQQLGSPVAVLQDLQGPKLRLGRLEGGGPVQLIEGQTLRITTRAVVGTAELISCTYADLPRDVRPGDHMLLDDGLLRLTVTAVEQDVVVTRVDEGGPLGEYKAHLIVKLEKAEAVDQLPDILEATNGIMVARGDRPPSAIEPKHDGPYRSGGGERAPAQPALRHLRRWSHPPTSWP
jgi:pyruvate kinase